MDDDELRIQEFEAEAREGRPWQMTPGDQARAKIIMRALRDEAVTVRPTCVACLEPRSLDPDHLCVSCQEQNLATDGALLALVTSTNKEVQASGDTQLCETQEHR